MAGILASVSQGSVNVNPGPTTVIQLIAPANQRLLVKQVIVSLDASVFCDVDIARQTSAGTSTGAVTPARVSAGSETLQATANHTMTAEPTTGATFYQFAISDRYELYLLPQDFIVVAGGERLGVIVTSASTVNVDATIIYEE